MFERHKIFTSTARVASYNSGGLASAPDVASLGAGFPPGTRAKALLRRSCRPQTDRTPFFWRHVQEGDLRFIRMALVAAGLSMAQGAAASAACVVLAGTADGFDKETAVSRAQRSLEDYIQQYKVENHLGAVTVSAMRAEPQPYWRGRVSENMMYHPDIVTEKSHTVCWQGVVSTYVCTSGAQVCW